VVEEAADMLAVERTHAFRGRYHVLQGALSPLHGVTPGDLRIDELLARLRQGGVREVVIATNFTVEGSKGITDGVLGTNHQFHETLEITQGFNDWFETGFYVFSSIQPNGGWQWVGDHIRPRVSVPEKWHWPVGLSLSQEIGYTQARFTGDTWTYELRPIIDKKLGPWYLGFNPAFDRSLHGPSVSKGWEFSPNVKISYDVTKKIAAGIEYSMGRIPMCKCGYIKFWHGGRGDSEMSQHLTDWCSYSHVLHGIIFYWLLSVIAKGRLSVAARLVIAMGLEAGWELFTPVTDLHGTDIVVRHPSRMFSFMRSGVKINCPDENAAPNIPKANPRRS